MFYYSTYMLTKTAERFVVKSSQNNYYLFCCVELVNSSLYNRSNQTSTILS